MKRIIFLFFLLSAKLVASAQPQCPVPFAQFTYTISNDGYSVIFSVDDCDPNYSYDWTFGDGASYHQTDSQADPTHTYSEDGIYLVTMTVKLPAPCTATYTQTAVITINHSSPSSMWLELSGPTLAGKCQLVSFNAQVTGGVPPYIYTWNMGPADCPDCSITCQARDDFQGNANESAMFSQTGLLTNQVCVSVTDANGNSDLKCLEIKVKDFSHPLEINFNGTKVGTCYVPNSNIVFLPDVDPLTSFEYPTNYYWDFDDGNTILDNYDGGGVVVHNYAIPPGGDKTYNVKLTVSDPNGSMQAMKEIKVCGSDNSGGEWILSNGSGNNTLTMYYPGQGNPIQANISLQNNTGLPCTNQNVRWKWQFKDEATLPVVVLNTMPGTLNPVLHKKCNSNEDILPHDYGSEYVLDLQDNSCGMMATGNNRKHWGCLSVQAIAYETSGPPPNNIVDDCESITNHCLIYIVPDELILSDIEVSGSCRTFDLLAHVEGGGWKLEGGEQKYKNYTWKAFDTNNHELEIDILNPAPGNPKGKMRIDLDHPYFDQFGPEQYVEFMVKLIVEDYANNMVETNQLISFNPFRLHLQDNYTRCPGVESHFSDKPLATGGSEGTYDYFWTGPGGLSGENPTFVAPQQGSVSYSVTVSDGDCDLNKTITVTATPLNLVLPNVTWPICETGDREIGPPKHENLGGSGHYTFAWSPTTYLNDPNVSYPIASEIPEGETITYTLLLSDIYGGCTSSDNLVVTSVANTYTASFPNSPINICYGENAVLIPQVSPIETAPPWGNTFNRFQWSTTNPHHDLSGVGSLWELPIDEIVSIYPSANLNVPFVYTVRYQNAITGCYAEASVNVRIRQPLKYRGYNSAIKYAVQGATVPLWEGADSDYNSVLSGIGNQGVTVEWFPSEPTHKIPGSYGIPQNARFIPTIDVPYLTMVVTDNATGCKKTFKSIRYIITQAQPELWMAASNTYFCLNGRICFDFVLDAHLVNYQTSLLPDKVTLSLAFQAPFNSPQQPDHIYSSVDLQLENSSGMYKGQYCEGDFFKSQTTSHPYKIVANTTALSYDIWGSLDCELEIEISGHDPAPDAITRCLPMNASVGEKAVKFDFGLQCLSSGLVSNDGGGNAVTTASDYIEFHPNDDIEIVPPPDAGDNIGRLFVINPCIVPQLVGENPETIIPPPGVIVDRINTALSESLAPPRLSVFPNPFGDEININIQIPADCVGKTTITLFDVTGKAIEVLQQIENCLQGKHQFMYNTGKLPPGLYFYELKTCKNQRIVQKAVKIGF